MRAVGRGCNPQHRRTDPQDPHPMSTLRPESTVPPAKPRRSFKRDEEPVPTAYLESCDYSGHEENQRNLCSEDVMDTEDLRGAQGEKETEEVTGIEEVGAEDMGDTEEEEEKTGVSGAEVSKVSDEEDVRDAEEVKSADEVDVIKSVAEVKGAEDVKGVEEETEVNSAEEERGVEEEREVNGGEEVKGAEEVRIIGERCTEEVIAAMSVEEVRSAELLREEEKDSSEERVTENVRSAEEEKGAEDEDQSDSSADTEGGNVEEQGGTEEMEEHTDAQPGEARRPRVRVIRLYQYNEDGERYYHLPGPSPQEPGPLPSLKQRSQSLTRLRAIMAAASAGPLETPEDQREREQGEDKAHSYVESSN